MNRDGMADSLKSVTIQQYRTDIGFRMLMEGVNDNLYIVPKYQRKYYWKREQVVSLVTSLLYRLPIPPIYTCRNSQNQLEILDGQQRVLSLFFYYIGYSLNNRKNSSVDFSELVTDQKSLKEALLSQYELEELHINLQGPDGKEKNVDYRTLPEQVKTQVDHTPLTIIEIKINDKNRKTEVLSQILENLNSAGPLLSDQEQRNGIYICPFYDMLRDFNQNDRRWRAVWGRGGTKEKDMETLLGMCALKHDVSVKENASDHEFVIERSGIRYKDFLDHFSKEAMEFSEREIGEYKSSLSDFMELLQLEEKVAVKPVLLESFYIVHEKMNVNKPITSHIYNVILENPRYKQYARQGTVKMKSMNERWKTVYEIWTGAD